MGKTTSAHLAGHECGYEVVEWGRVAVGPSVDLGGSRSVPPSNLGVEWSPVECGWWHCGTVELCGPVQRRPWGGGLKPFRLFLNADEYPPGAAPTNLWATVGPFGNLQGNLQGTVSLFFWGGKGNAKNIQIEWSTD